MGIGIEHTGVTSDVLSGGPEIVEGLAAEWRQLCDASDAPLPFTRPEWVGAYFRSNDKARRFLILTVRIDGKLIAVLPFIDRKRRISHIPANVLRGPSDFDLWPMDMLVSDESVQRIVALEFWGLIRDMKEWDIVELPNIPAGGASEEFLKAAAGEGFPSHRWEYMQSPCICLEDRAGTEDPSDVAASAHLRKNIRNTLRKVEKEGGIEVRRSERFDPVLLRWLNDLEASGWKGERGSTIFLREKDRRFWHEVSAAAQKFGYLAMYSMEWKGRVIAVSLCFEYKKRIFGVKMGWDQALRSFSPGHLLLRGILKDCLGNGITRVHLMGLRAAWKEQWTRTALPHATCYVFRKGLYGRAVKAAVCRSISGTVEASPEKKENPGAAGAE